MSDYGYGDYFSDPYVDYIVPPDYPGSPSSPPSRQTPQATTQSQAPSYETPWYVDTINRAIERASQVATVDVAGYPPYPAYPNPGPYCGPNGCGPGPSRGVQPQSTAGFGFQISPMTALIAFALGFAFLSGRGRR